MLLPHLRVFRVLLRHFIQQFFVSESIVPGSEGYRSTVPVLAVLTAPGLFIPLFWLLPVYAGLAAYPIETQQLVIRYHQFFFITLSMALACCVALVHWDRLFLTGRDCSILKPLPIPQVELYASKLVALFLYAATFTGAVNFFSVILFPGVARFRAVEPGSGLDFFWGHAAGVFGGSLFVFFLVVTVQGVILSLCRWRAGSILRLVQMSILLLLMLLFSLYGSLFESWEVVTGRLSWVQFLFPPFWFLGLAQTVAGANEPELVRLGLLAQWALGFVLLLGSALQLTVRREERLSDQDMGSVFLRGVQSAVNRFWTGYCLRTPVERGTVFFLVKTLMRSPRQRLILVGFVGLGLGLSMASGWPFSSSVLADGIERDLFAIPQILTFFLIVGMRTAFSDPAEPAARWLFLLTLESPGSRYLAGARKLMVAAAVALLLLLTPVHVYLWGWTLAVLQFGFSLVLALTLIEIVLFGFHRIPFTATYWPGSSKLKVWWTLYALGFIFYAYSTATFEGWLLEVPVRAFLFEVAGLFILAAWYLSRWILLDPKVSVSFEQDDPDKLLLLSLR